MVNTNVSSNLEALGELIGSLKGVNTALEDDEYMDGLIERAHTRASKNFDLAAAATGAAGHLTHMFEYGVPGITRGKAQFPDPTSPAARLWVHNRNGSGGRQEITFSFRPALNRNPRPTTRDTGVPSKYIRKISRRKYVFRQKAFVTEMGITVERHAKNGDFLFVPFGHEPPRNPLNKKNFVMWNTRTQGPLETQPGRTQKGTFSAFWMRWWSSQGEKTMSQSMSRKIRFDIKKAEESMTRRANSAAVKPAAMINLQATIASAKLAAEKQFGRIEMNE